MRASQSKPQTATNSTQTQSELVALANRLRWLAPNHKDPERFHVEKSEIERALRRMAGQQTGRR